MAIDDPDGEDYEDGLDAFDVYAPESPDDAPELAELPDHPAPDPALEQQLSDIDADFDSLSPSSPTDIDPYADGGSDDFLDEVEPDSAAAEEQALTLQATNPPGTVTVTTYLTGVIARVELDPMATAMTEIELAKEVGAVADVATKRASAIIHDSIVSSLVEHGMRREDAQYFVDTNMPFATQEQANEAELALVARHSDQDA